ncbi:hypothetical protein DFH06DRAFT_1130878 [Mycena polygramma]|nr:hypothetical protein DFH06DRAFT_1130878 [Mycena polygramma]
MASGRVCLLIPKNAITCASTPKGRQRTRNAEENRGVEGWEKGTGSRSPTIPRSFPRKWRRQDRPNPTLCNMAPKEKDIRDENKWDQCHKFQWQRRERHSQIHESKDTQAQVLKRPEWPRKRKRPVPDTETACNKAACAAAGCPGRPRRRLTAAREHGARKYGTNACPPSAAASASATVHSQGEAERHSFAAIASDITIARGARSIASHRRKGKKIWDEVLVLEAVMTR